MPSNVDLTEIDKFTAQASQWWDPKGPCKPLHELNPLRLQFIQQYVTLAQQKVLDVGCGGGILSESMAKVGALVTGIDMGAAVLKVAKLHSLEENLSIHYQEIPVENFAVQHPKAFHVVTCMELLEHVPDPRSIIQACADLTAPNGYVFFSTLNRHPLAYLQAIIGGEYILNLLPRGTHDYQKFIRPAELIQNLRDVGLNLVNIAGLNYNPFTRKFSLSNSTKIHYLVCAQKSGRFL